MWASGPISSPPTKVSPEVMPGGSPSGYQAGLPSPEALAGHPMGKYPLPGMAPSWGPTAVCRTDDRAAGERTL